MKTKNFLMAGALLLAGMTLMPGVVNAQTSMDEQVACYRDCHKKEAMTRRDAERKALKTAKNQAKALKKQGWVAAPGMQPLEQQLTEVYLREYEYDGNFPKYILGRDQAVGSNFSGAKAQALAGARTDIANSVSTAVNDLTETTTTNLNFSAEEVQTISRMVKGSNLATSQRLGRTDIIFMACRERNGHTEVSVVVSCNGNMIRDEVLRIFENDHRDIHDKLERSMNAQKAR